MFGKTLAGRCWLLLLLVLVGVSFAPSQGAAATDFKPAFSDVRTDKGPIFRDRCLLYGEMVVSGKCTYGDVDSRLVVVLFGDSHALQWSPALTEVAKQRGWRLVALLRGSCAIADVDFGAFCNQWRENSLERIRELEPGLVITGSATGPGYGVHQDGRILSREESEPLLKAGMDRTLGKLVEYSDAVTTIRDIAKADFLPSECVEANQKNPQDCDFTGDRPPGLAYDLKAARGNDRVQLLDPYTRLCPEDRCSAVRDSTLVFRDKAHVSATYAATFADWFDQRLQSPWFSAWFW